VGTARRQGRLPTLLQAQRDRAGRAGYVDGSGDVSEYHVGLPVHVRDVLDRIKRGLPVYWPTDPKPIDQTVYVRFAAKTEGAPKP
jgi:hypothetical protein